jgi:hypothetical protein
MLEGETRAGAYRVRHVECYRHCYRIGLMPEHSYLNAEQRRNYMVDVKDGLLVWARNGRRVDSAD